MSEKGYEKDEKKRKSLPTLINYLNGGAAGMCALFFDHPMDVLKNRLQMNKGRIKVTTVVSNIIRKEGILKFYAGLSAGLLRQSTYTTTRLGTYNKFQDLYMDHYPDTKAPFWVLALMAACAGSLGALVGTPADVALVRMTSDGRLPPDALHRIVQEEGVLKLWRGSIVTIGRATVVNVSQLASYSYTKNFVSDNFNIKGIPSHLYASMISGLLTAFTSLPFDIAKTRIQNLGTEVIKTPSIINVMINLAKNEGFLALWKGFLPYYGRLGPHTILTLMFNEQFNNLYKTYFM